MGARVLSQTRAWRRLSIVAVLLLLTTALVAFLVLTYATSTATTFASSHTEFKALAMNPENYQVCGIIDDSGGTNDGKITCWGRLWSSPSRTPPTDGGYVSLHMSPAWNCALKSNGSAKCFGSDSNSGPSDLAKTTPTGKYHDIALTGAVHACWIKRDDSTASEDGKVKCEALYSGYDNDPRVVIPVALRSYKFESVYVTYGDTCAIVEDSDRSTAGNQDEGGRQVLGQQQCTSQFVANQRGVQVVGLRRTERTARLRRHQRQRHDELD